MDDLIYNYMAFLETVFSEHEILPDTILKKYGLLNLTPREIKRLESMEMRRLYTENMTLNKIGKRFNMSESGVFRRIQRLL